MRLLPLWAIVIIMRSCFGNIIYILLPRHYHRLAHAKSTFAVERFSAGGCKNIDKTNNEKHVTIIISGFTVLCSLLGPFCEALDDQNAGVYEQLTDRVC